MAAAENSQLHDLVSLIKSSVDDIISEYKTSGTSISLLDSAVDGPFDAPETASEKLLRSIRIVEAACAQLCATISSPALSLLNKALAFEECACIQVVCEARVADYLDGKPAGVSVIELGKLTGINSDKLARVLRLLATKHVFREVRPNVFSNNRLSHQLLSSKSSSDYYRLATRICFKPAPLMFETLSDHSPTAPKDCFRRLYGKTMFEHLGSEQGWEDAQIFAKGMVGGGDLTGGTGSLIKAYPWDSLLKDAGPIHFCDVGGGNGHVSLELMRAFPSIPFQVTVQDIPNMVDQGKVLWAQQLPDAVLNGRVELKTLDFFEQSPVSGCNFYYLRHCLHNWSDQKCIVILKNIAAAMASSSRLLIHDLIVTYALPAKSDYAPPGIDIAPAPLLKNFGAGAVRAYNTDINMLCMLGDAKERTVEQFSELAAQAGLTFVRAYDACSTLESILEFRLQ